MQVCAAGALLNILGPAVSAAGPEQRHGMCKIISLVMATAAVYEGCFEHRPQLELC
jgi:energy-converting hydrogenase Eha subunit E